MCSLLSLLTALLLTLLTLHTAIAEEVPGNSTHQAARQHQDSDMAGDWRTASWFLGLDPAEGVASLITASLTQASDKQGTDPQSTSLFHGFFRLLGFDTSKLNAIAVNAVVFIAKMIGSSLIKNFTGESVGRSMGTEEEPGEPSLSMILEDVKSQARSILARAQDEALPDQLISALQTLPGDTDCVQLLVCRAAPLLRGMQRSLLSRPPYHAEDEELPPSLSPLSRLHQHLPGRQDLMAAASDCASRLPSCSSLFAGLDM